MRKWYNENRQRQTAPNHELDKIMLGGMSVSLAFDKAQDSLGKSLGLAGDTFAKYFDSHDNGVYYRLAGQNGRSVLRKFGGCLRCCLFSWGFDCPIRKL